ncbi:MAG: hypothetical protein BroJett003_15510 [Planctomycetota bacterium]|nr:MAG: hypothetical protein BroJett003_15510 [Planctomycetota bacterium]
MSIAPVPIAALVTLAPIPADGRASIVLDAIGKPLNHRVSPVCASGLNTRKPMRLSQEYGFQLGGQTDPPESEDSIVERFTTEALRLYPEIAMRLGSGQTPVYAFGEE